MKRRARSTPPPTSSDVRRFSAIKELGCIACRLREVGRIWPEIHHLTVTGRHGGKRRGHEASVGLCPWHHRGIPFLGLTLGSTEAVAGPSMKHTPRAFREEFGQDERLLEYQNGLLGIVAQ